MTMQNLREQLYDKAADEQERYVEELKLQPPDKIIAAAYEKATRDDILMSFEPDNTFLDDKQVKALLKLDYPLAACYDEWLKTDCSYMDMLRDTIEDFSKDLVKEQSEKAHKKKNEPER